MRPEAVSDKLARAFQATGTGPWCLRRFCPRTRPARYKLWFYMRNVMRLKFSAIGDLCGVHHTTVLHALKYPPPPGEVKPPDRIKAECEYRARRELGVHEPIWERNGWGEFWRRDGRARARRLTWRYMREAGMSCPEIALVCGMRSHSTIVEGTRPEAGTRVAGEACKDAG